MLGNMRQYRINCDAQDARIAREEYGADFDTTFETRQHGKRAKVMKKDCDIATEYRHLKCLPFQYWHRLDDFYDF